MTKTKPLTSNLWSSRLSRASLLVIAISAFLALSGFYALAQYKAIPNYVGVNAGLQFRTDINNHLSGATPIAPRLVSLPFLQLPPETDGQLYWCADCRVSTSCQGGGGGAMAVGQGGAWTCGGMGPLGGNLDANKNRVINLAPNATPGDALSQGQSHLNDLATATASYNMGANKLANLGPDSITGDALSRGQSTMNSLAVPAASVPMNNQKFTGMAAGMNNGDSLSQSQSGAILNGLSLNGSQLSNLSAASAGGQAIENTQSGAQLTTPLITQNQAGWSVVSSSSLNDGTCSYCGVTSETITAPGGIVNGDTLILVAAWTNRFIGNTLPASIVPPPGFTQVRYDTADNVASGVYCKVADNESGNYTISWTNNEHFAGGIAQVSGLNGCGTDGSGSVGAGTGTTITAPAPTLKLTNDFILGTTNGNGYPPTGGSPGAQVWNTTSSFVEGGAYYFNASAGAAKTFSATTTDSVVQIAQQVPFASASTLQSVPIINGGAGNSLQDLSASVNGVINASAPPYNAACDGNTDDSAAIQAALNTGKSVELPDSGLLCKITVPLVDSTTNNRSFFGRSMLRSGLLPSFIGGPAIIEANPATEVNAVGPITTASHLGGGVALCWANGNTFCGSATGSSPGQYAYDVKDWLSKGTSNPLNGLSPGQLTIQAEVYVPSVTSGGALTSSGSNMSGTIHTLDIFDNWGQQGDFQTSININGTQQTLRSAGGSLTAGWHHYAFVYDNNSGNGCSTTSCLRQYIDGVQVNSLDVSGNIVQPTYDTWWLGAYANRFPNGDPQEGGLPYYMEGAIDYFDMEKADLYPGGTTFTPPTSKPYTNNNQIVYVAGDKTPAITGLGSTIAATGIVGADSQNAWGYIRVAPLLSGEIGTHVIHNMTINGAGEDVLASNAIDLQFHDVNFTANHVPIKAYNNSYSMHAYNLWLTTYGECGMELSHNSFFESAGTVHINNGNACMLAAYDQSGGNFDGLFLNPQLGTAPFALIYGNDSLFDSLVISNIGIDSENGAPTIADMEIEGGNVTLTGGDLEAISPAVPAVELLAGSTVTMVGTHIEAGSSTTPIFHWLSAPGGTNPHLTCVNCLAVGQPLGWQSNELTDQPAYVDLLGSQVSIGGVPALQSGLNHLNVNKVSDPAAPAITFVGAAGTTSYGPYYSVCHDVNGGVTNVSPISNTLANGNATLSSSNYVQIDLGALPAGCATYDVLKGNLTTALMTAQVNYGGDTKVKDSGQSTSAYSYPSRNTTGDVTVGTMEVSSGLSWPLPTQVVNGASFYCPNCDPPANPPAACTSSGAKTGSFVHGLNNQWLCAP